MKTPTKYRFTLQWGTETAEKIQAGDFLESLGNRKSEIVVMAVTEFISANPEVLSTEQKRQIIIKPSYTRDQMKAIVLAVLEEKLAGIPVLVPESTDTIAESIVTESEVEEMLNNLDIFS